MSVSFDASGLRNFWSKECVRGLVSDDADEGFPRHVWMIDGERVIEARCDNVEAATYHGYPLEADDPMTDMVRREWSRRQAQ